jgi:site-specific recombinase XerC
MPAALVLDAEHVDAVVEYLAAMRMRTAGRKTGHSTVRACRTFCAKLQRAGCWEQLSLSTQLDAIRKGRSFASWLIVTGQLAVDAVRARPYRDRRRLCRPRHAGVVTEHHVDFPAAAKLLHTARQDADPLARLVTELLARTGIRRGELLSLTVDAVVQIGSAYWLRILVGKLHNDRHIPLHPQLKELLDDWVANHWPAGIRSDRLLIERNRPVIAHRVAKILRQQTGDTGI